MPQVRHQVGANRRPWDAGLPQVRFRIRTDDTGLALPECVLKLTRYVNANNTMQGVGFGFRLWHAQGINIERVNLTFDIGPSPADVWVSQFSYYTGSNPPLRFANA